MALQNTGRFRRATVLLPILVLSALIIVGARTLIPAEDPAGAGIAALTYAWAALAACLLSCKDRRRRHIFPQELLPAVFVLPTVLVADPLTRTIGASLVAFVIVAVLLAANIRIVARRIPTAVSIALLAAASALPIWAGPLVELSGNPGWLNRLVLWSSPLTPLAVAIDLDYLRTAWFYRNSALGSMRYEYPGLVASCLVLSVLPVTAAFRNRLGLAVTSVYPLQREVVR